MPVDIVEEPVVTDLERQLTSCEDIKRYIFAGNATFTLRSVATQKRFTYKITSIGRQDVRHSGLKKDDPRRKELFKVNGHKFFVNLMVGPDNERSFAYIGIIDLNAPRKFRTTSKSFLAMSAKEKSELAPVSVKAISFFMNWLFSQIFMTPKIEVWHSGRCGMCGKKLTVPESIEKGIGPDCASRM